MKNTQAEWRNGRRSGLKRHFDSFWRAFGSTNSRNSNGGDSGDSESGDQKGTSRGTWGDAGVLGIVVITALALYIVGSWIWRSAHDAEVSDFEERQRDMQKDIGEKIERFQEERDRVKLAGY